MPNMEMTVYCKLCKKPTKISVDIDGFRAWLRGELIQNALPDTPAGVRELLVSRVCEPCFDKMFAEEDNG